MKKIKNSMYYLILIPQCAIRELNEELGLDLNKEEISKKTKFEFFGKNFYKDLIVTTWSYIYILHISSDIESEIKFSDGEVESVKWLTIDEIVEKIKKARETY